MAESHVPSAVFIVEERLGCDVVIGEDLAIRKLEDIVERVITHRMVNDEEGVGIAEIRGDRSDLLAKGRVYVLAEDLGAVPELPEVIPPREHLVRDGISDTGAGVELIDRRGDAVHRYAITA